MAPKERFAALFAKRAQWTLADISPYVVYVVLCFTCQPTHPFFFPFFHRTQPTGIARAHRGETTVQVHASILEQCWRACLLAAVTTLLLIVFISIFSKQRVFVCSNIGSIVVVQEKKKITKKKERARGYVGDSRARRGRRPRLRRRRRRPRQNPCRGPR
jgi:hypothetical protein